jgi:hypothetical protein
MIFFAILLTTMLILFFYMANQTFEFTSSPKKIIPELKQFPTKLDQIPYLYLGLAFFCFMILPLLWGLNFYLKSDANVLVTVLALAWIYNWIRILYFSKKEK